VFESGNRRGPEIDIFLDDMLVVLIQYFTFGSVLHQVSIRSLASL
jgi:hypothetical protein